MDNLFRVLRSRRGESMVEILVSTVVFMLLLGALNGAVGFAANAQRKSEQLRQDATELQRSVRETSPAGDTTDTYSFRLTTADGDTVYDEKFRVTVKKQTVDAKTNDNKTVTFYRFAEGRSTP